jgi:putative ABC transport system permease protein
MNHALRSLAKSPGFTITALITLALGIGVNTSMFSVLNALLFRSLPYAEPERLVRIFRTDPRSQTLPHAPANYLDYVGQNRSFESIATLSWTNYNLSANREPALRLLALETSASFFDVLGVKPALGRVFTVEEDQPGRNAVVVLSHPFWEKRFAADPSVVGREIRLDGEPVTVIGVMPPGFDDRMLFAQPSVWRPIAFTNEQRQNRGGNYLQVIGRLKPGVTLPQAQDEMSALAASLAKAHPTTNANNDFNLVGLARSGQDDASRTISWFAMGLAGCVLLIACANLANLQFARNAARGRENAVRAALGASRLHLLRQSFTESFLLALVGGALGLIVTIWCNDALSAGLVVAGGSGFAIPTNFRVLGFALGAAIFTGIAFGTLPAWLASRADVNDALKQGTRGTTSGAHHRVRSFLIVAEFTLALVLLASAGFFLRGLERFVNRDHGWETSRLLTAGISLSPSKYPNDPARVAFYDRLVTRLSALPGIERVALSSTVPYADFSGGQRFVVEGQPAPATGAEPMRLVNYVDATFFDALQLPIMEGRAFTASDINGPIRTIINASMARRFWPGESAIGKRIRHPNDTVWQEIVGVVGDVRFPTRLDEPRTQFQAYRFLAREPRRDLTITLRSTAAPETLASGLRQAINEIDPEQPVQDVRAAKEVIDRGLANLTVIGWLLSGFAALGMLLAGVGVYGVISGSVVQRTTEIGIRLALGAQIADVLRLIVGQGLKLALIGSAIGLFGAYAAARMLTSMMPALPAAEPLIAALVTVILLSVALLACWIPARKAARVDPMEALRAE